MDLKDEADRCDNLELISFSIIDGCPIYEINIRNIRIDKILDRKKADFPKGGQIITPLKDHSYWR